jgi:TolA-binding protein
MGTTAAEQAGATPKAPAPTVDIAAWLQARQKAIGIVVLAVFLVGLGAWYVVESGRRKQVQASDALDRARASMDGGNYPEASTQLQKVAQTYAGTDAALEATLALNQVRLMSGQAQLAVDELRKFAATNPGGAFGAAAHLHLAIALENTGKTTEATAEYLRAAELAPDGFRKVDALLAAARTYRLTGKEQEAIALLQDVVKKYPKEGAGVAEAKVRLAELTKGRI